MQVDATENEMTEGSFQTTSNPLDVAIEGDGFLRVGEGEPKEAELTDNSQPTSSTREPAI